MANNKLVGKYAYIKELKKIGVISETSAAGVPIKVIIDDEIIDVVNLTVKIYGLLRQLWFIIKGIF